VMTKLVINRQDYPASAGFFFAPAKGHETSIIIDGCLWPRLCENARTTDQDSTIPRRYSQI
jgi:hypothetical protein